MRSALRRINAWYGLSDQRRASGIQAACCDAVMACHSSTRSRSLGHHRSGELVAVLGLASFKGMTVLNRHWRYGLQLPTEPAAAIEWCGGGAGLVGMIVGGLFLNFFSERQLGGVS